MGNAFAIARVARAFILPALFLCIKFDFATLSAVLKSRVSATEAPSLFCVARFFLNSFTACFSAVFRRMFAARFRTF